MEWPAKQRRTDAIFNHSTGIHDGYAIGESGKKRWIVSDEQDGGAKCLIEVPHYAENLGLHSHVERSGRFVGNNQVWPARQRLGNRHSMQFPAAELMRVSRVDPLDVCQLDLTQGRLDFQFARLPGELAVCADDLGNLIADAHYRTQRKARLLMDQGNPGTPNSA